MLIKSLALAASIIAVSSVSYGQDEAPAGETEAKPGTTGAEIVHLPPTHRPRWEYGFDLDGTYVQDAFTPYLAAQWNYVIRPFDTMVGAALSATPQTVRKNYTGGKSETSLYTWGVDLRQDFVESGDFTLGLSLVVGSGVAYLRFKDVDKPTSIHGISTFHVEPGVYGTVLSYKSVEIGATAGMRLITVADNIKEVKSEDLTSFVVGLTFRERHAL